MKKKISSEIIAINQADDIWGVTTVLSKAKEYNHMKSPCATCPWRKDAQTGAFPAEAFRLSAGTAYDAAQKSFGCHTTSSDNPHTCAGFLLANADNNINVRLGIMSGKIDMSKISSDVELYESYKDMAISNGVDPEDPVLKPCRSNNEWIQNE